MVFCYGELRRVKHQTKPISQTKKLAFIEYLTFLSNRLSFLFNNQEKCGLIHIFTIKLTYTLHLWSIKKLSSLTYFSNPIILPTFPYMIVLQHPLVFFFSLHKSLLLPSGTFANMMVSLLSTFFPNSAGLLLATYFSDSISSLNFLENVFLTSQFKSVPNSFKHYDAYYICHPLS